MVPLTLRIATGLSVALSASHLIIITAVAYQFPREILGREVGVCGLSGDYIMGDFMNVCVTL